MSFKISAEIGLLGENKFANVPFKGPNQGFDPSKEAKAGTKIEFIPIHYKKAPVISFIAYMKNIKDTFNQKVNEQQVFGRVDPIRLWKTSNRQISLDISIPSSDEEMALRNLNNLNWLLASGYPTYASSGNCTKCSAAVAASPLFRVKYANLISDTPGDLGLLCVIQTFSVTHEFDKGAIHVRPADGPDLSLLTNAGFTQKAGRYVVASNISLNLTLDVVHERSMGWDAQTGEWRTKGGAFPYGTGLQKHSSTPPAASTGGSTAQASAATDDFKAEVVSPAAREIAAAAKKAIGPVT